jgi:outer membrane receptor protein involved in Fe transport
MTAPDRRCVRARLAVCGGPLLAAVLGLGGAADGLAQTAQAAGGAAPDQPIVVSGAPPAARSTIDRKIYTVGSDLQSGSGSASDVLRNIPSVDVDAQGAVSLRGDTHVTVLIDGKPSTTLTSATAADALEQFPANTIERVEVITNPSARFKPDGSGGIINIITKKSRKHGLTGLVSASGGSDGRFNLAAKASWRGKDLSATASATLHRDMRHRPYSDQRSEIDPQTGSTATSTQDTLFHGEKLSRIVSGSVDYDWSAHDRLSAAGSYTLRTGTPRTDQHDVIRDAGGLVSSALDRHGLGHEHEVSDEASAKYRHTFARKGQEFTLEVRRGETVENELRRFTDMYQQPPGLITIDQQRPRLDIVQREATAEYTQPLGPGKVLAGFDWQRDDDDFQNHGDLIDPATGAVTVDPVHTDHFAYAQTVADWYATYDTPLAKSLSAVLGLRLEQATITANQIALALVSRQSYVRVYPTASLQYDLGGGDSLKFSASKRIVRPDPEDLNPAPEFSDPLNQRAGNPDLKPQDIVALEAGFQHEARGLSLEATLFVRQIRNGFTDVSRFIAPNVLLTRKENLGRASTVGLDFSASGKLSTVVSYRINGTLGRNRIDASNLGFAGTRSLVALTLKSGLDAKLSRTDLVQVSANLNGERLTPQGYRLPSASANIGYRHVFHGGLSAVASVSDVFNTQKDRVTLTSPTLIERTTRRNTGRLVSLALSLPLGGGQSGTEAPIEFGE